MKTRKQAKNYLELRVEKRIKNNCLQHLRQFLNYAIPNTDMTFSNHQEDKYTDDQLITDKGPFKYDMSDNGPHGSNAKPATMVIRKRYFSPTNSSESSPANKQEQNFDALL